jgi:uncharacterized protein
LLLPISAQSQSFDCNTNRQPAEIKICQNRELSRLDERMDYWYNNRKSDYTGAVLRSFVQEQRAWLRHRNECRYDSECIKDTYIQRIQEIMGE